MYNNFLELYYIFRTNEIFEGLRDISLAINLWRENHSSHFRIWIFSVHSHSHTVHWVFCFRVFM